MKKFKLWLPYLNIHLLGLIETIIKNEGLVVSSVETYEDKRAFIKKVPLESIHFIDKKSLRNQVTKSVNYINIIYGFDMFEWGKLSSFFRESNLLFYVLSEPPNIYSLKAPLRIIKHQIFLYKNRKNLLGVLGIGYWSKFLHKNLFKIRIIDSLYYPKLSYKETIKSPPDYKKIIFVGGLIPRKGIIYLLIIHLLLGKNSELKIIGQGPFKILIKIAKLISSKIIFIEGLENEKILKEISNSDILILPSFWDGFGVVILEAISENTPVVVSKFVGARSISNNTKSGMAVGILKWYLNGQVIPNVKMKKTIFAPEYLLNKL